MKDTNPKINCLLQIMSMSRLGLMYRLFPRAPAMTSILRPGLVFDVPPCSRGAKAAAKGGAKGGGKKGAAMVKVKGAAMVPRGTVPCLRPFIKAWQRALPLPTT